MQSFHKLAKLLEPNKPATSKKAFELSPTQAEAAQRILSMLAGTAAVGAGLRGAVGAIDTFTGKDVATPVIANKPIILDMPFQKKKKTKLANFFFPAGAPRPDDMPGFYPGLVTAGGVGGLAGYKLMDWLMKKKKQKDLHQQLTDSKTDYQAALSSQLDPEKSAIDRLTINFTKSALSSGQLLGMYLAAAVPLAGFSGLATYKYLNQSNPDKLLEDAVREREKRRWLSKPPEIYVRTPSLNNKAQLPNTERKI